MSIQDDSAAQQSCQDIELVVRLAFRTSHLITGSVPLAEKAVLNALDRFDPDRDSQRTLLWYAVAAAIEQPASELPPRNSGDPVELDAVLALPDLLRCCFVLRFLIRYSPGACAGLLHLSVDAVNEYSCVAVQRLAGLDPAVRTVSRRKRGDHLRRQ